MSGLLTYAVGSALVLCILWAGFRLLFYGQKTIRINRFLLNMILCFSLCVPVLMSYVSIPVSGKTQDVVGVMAIVDNPYGEFHTEDIWLAADGRVSMFQKMLVWLYLAGISAFLLLQVVIPSLSVAVLLRRGCRTRIAMGRRKVNMVRVPARHGRIVEPMSWLGTVILPAEEDFSEDSYVIRHELAHVRMRHPLQSLAASVLVSVQWFNPAAWFLLKDLRQNCEFEADDAVLSSGADSRDYRMALLARKANGMMLPLASHFRKSSLYHRIVMIQKTAPPRRVYARLMYVIPVILMSAVVFAHPAVSIDASSVKADAVAGTLPEDGAEDGNAALVPFSVVEEQPLFQGGNANNFTAWLYSRLKYPEAARAAGAGARLFVRMTIGKDGMMSDFKLVKMIPSVGTPDKFDCSVFYDAVQEALSVPLRWTPGRIGGKPVPVSYMFPVTFQLKG